MYSSSDYFFMAFSVCLVLFIIYGICRTIHREKCGYNKGVCPKCGKKLRYADMDSQGGRLYRCDDCNYSTWVSYNFIDKL